ncbi:NAD(P)/FAD-dependent oxidoreductase [Aureisphaera galaxeae]|uniref:NAD(P)/FAD-dependent oxidoreductase n=1 Tax=Aureisphaera galaxeae TaxID=1538023 RepID=UPI0023510212|nr:NAD(P)/FAD-dependent oxidoreductase [Aureisphaera galaxeae]MDC8005536.1 NAD(P)/FAD-dependent oxidoreductase [Aureisphaera galaxeae]
MNLKHNTYDVLILGGGIAACSAAIALKNNAPDLKVLLVERKPRVKRGKDALRIGESLSAHSFRYLQELGVWDAFQKEGFDHSFGTSAAWGNSQMHHNEFLFSPFGYGWNLDRAAFDDFMIREAIEREVDITFKTYLKSSKEVDEGWEVQLQKGDHRETLQTKFIIDATGKKAAFASAQGATKHKVDNLVGVFRFYEFPLGHAKTSQGILIESDEKGWWYSTHLSKGRFLVAYMTDADMARNHNLKEDIVFEEHINVTRHTCLRLFGAKPLGSVALGAAHSQYLEPMASRNWLAVGDAVMSYDPLSSLGMFKGLSSGLFGAYAVMDVLKGVSGGIQKYERLMHSQWTSYSEKRTSYYNEETRFPESPFWQRRASVLQDDTINNQLHKPNHHETSIAI